MKRIFNSVKLTMLSLGTTLAFTVAFNSAYAQPCSAAIASATLPSTQCLPVEFDGSASVNEDNWWIEIVEVNQINGNIVGGTMYQNWFVGEQASLITDLGAKTSYNFQHGKRYRIKMAVQSYHPNGGWCTQWSQTSHMFVDIEDMATCSASQLVIHEMYDWQHECITHFQAASNYDNSLISSVTFSLGGTTFTDNVPTYIYYMPNSGPFVGTVYATFNFTDGTSHTISQAYQKCEVVVTDPHGGTKGRVSNPSVNSDALVFPNPSNGAFSIKNNNEEAVEVEIYSTNGTLLRKFDIQEQSTFDVNLTEVSAGIYFAKIVSESGNVEEHKIVIE